MQPQVDSWLGSERSIQQEGVPDMAGHDVIDALVNASLCDVPALRVTERYPYPYPVLRSFPQQPLHIGVLG